jgi:hypothetical protein
VATIYSVDDIYQWVNNGLANQLQSGEWQDTTFNLALKFVNIELLRSEVGLPESYQAGNPNPSIAWQMTNTISDDLRYLVKPTNITQNADGYFAFPPDYAGFSSLWYRYVLNAATCGGQPFVKDSYIEPVSDDELRVRLPSAIKKPDLRYPVASWITDPNGNVPSFQVYPAKIKVVELTYLRYPATPVWGFTTLANGQTQYDATSSVQPEYPDTLIPNLAVRVARYFGINLREDQFLSYIQQRSKAGE